MRLEFSSPNIPVALVCCLVGLASCSMAPHKPIHLTIAIDVSDQTEDRILAYASQAYRLQAQLDAGDELEIITFAHQTDIVYDGHPVFERNQFNETIASSLMANHTGLHTPGTRADTLLQAMAVRSATAKKPLFIVIFTDGGIEDQSLPATSRMASAIMKASKSAELKRFVVVGVDQQWRSQWQQWLKSLGQKAQVQGTKDGDHILDGITAVEDGGVK